jgi:hypothetical protein
MSMRIITYIFLLAAVATLAGCKKTRQQADLAALENLFMEIQALANSKTCQTAEAWDFIAYGDKACGGPVGYIAYPIEIQQEIVEKVTEYTEMQKAFNDTYNVGSDCMFVSPPAGVGCKDGKAVFE